MYMFLSIMIRISNGYVKKKYLLYNFNIFSILNEKIKELDHYIALKEYDEKKKGE